MKNQKETNVKKSKLKILSIFSLPNFFTQDIKRSVRLVKEAKAVLTQKDERKIVAYETFDEMIARMGITEDELAQKIKISKIQSVIYGSAAVFFVMWTIILQSFPGIFAGLCATTIASMLWFRWSLRLWRLRNRDLGSHKEFLSTSWYLEWLK